MHSPRVRKGSTPRADAPERGRLWAAISGLAPVRGRRPRAARWKARNAGWSKRRVPLLSCVRCPGTPGLVVEPNVLECATSLRRLYRQRNASPISGGHATDRRQRECRQHSDRLIKLYHRRMPEGARTESRDIVISELLVQSSGSQARAKGFTRPHHANDMIPIDSRGTSMSLFTARRERTLS